MGQHLKIHQGTGRLTGKALCFSCTNAVVKNGEDVICGIGGYDDVRITKPVFECSKYYNSSLPNLHAMETVAWEIKCKDGKKVGFFPPEKKRDDDY